MLPAHCGGRVTVQEGLTPWPGTGVSPVESAWGGESAGLSVPHGSCCGAAAVRGSELKHSVLMWSFGRWQARRGTSGSSDKEKARVCSNSPLKETPACFVAHGLGIILTHTAHQRSGTGNCLTLDMVAPLLFPLPFRRADTRVVG